jgi:DNA-binding Lrp family transcriptional regulator
MIKVLSKMRKSIYEMTKTLLTSHDRQLLSSLKRDGRASVTNLALSLGLSRATVHTRIERLVSSGVIQRFTIDVDAGVEAGMIRAVTMIELAGAMSRSVTNILKSMDEVVSLHTTNGTWDLVAHLETTNLPEFDGVLRRIREISGVLNSETSLLLNTVSSR